MIALKGQDCRVDASRSRFAAVSRNVFFQVIVTGFIGLDVHELGVAIGSTNLFVAQSAMVSPV